ncbi:unnamed protein product [Calypogeia fissa]
MESKPIVLEDWLRVAISSVPSASSALAPASIQVAVAQVPANAIAHAWSQTRAFVQQQKALTSSDSEPFNLLNQHLRSLHLADSQAKLLQALLTEVNSSDAALLGFIRRFAVLGLLAWIRKSFTVPASTASATSVKVPPETVASIAQNLLKAMEERPVSNFYTCEAILLIGTISNLPNVSAAVRNDCLSAIATELANRREVITRGALAEALAGAGYALAVSSEDHMVSIFQSLLLLWTQSGELQSGAGVMEGELDNAQMSREQDKSVLKDQIMLLHLLDFFGSILISRENSQAGNGASQMELIQTTTRRLLENNTNMHFIQCTSSMACLGLLRSFYRWDQGNKKRGIPSPNRHKWDPVVGNLESIVIMICEQVLTPGVEMSSVFLAGPLPGPPGVSMAAKRHLCRCVSVAVSRCRGLPAHPHIMRCLLFSIFSDALSLDTLYSVFTFELATGSLSHRKKLGEVHASQEENMLPTGNEDDLSRELHDFQVHIDSFFLKELGAMARAMRDQYRLTSGDLRGETEHLVSEYARNLHERHRLLVAASQAFKNQDWSKYRQTLEKVLETAFMTVVIFFSLAVNEQVPNDNDSSEAERAALALDSLSCVEYFRHVQLREFSKVIQRSVTHIAGSEAASVFLVRLLPSYEDIIKKPGTPDLNLTISWAQDEVQTARLLFYLRVMPLCLIKMPEETFAEGLAPTMFLYLQHPSETVSRAAHALFAAFLSLGVRSDETVITGTGKSHSSSSRPENKVTLREQLVVHYMHRALQSFPGITPFQGLVTGVGAIARQLPPGSPATVYCLKSLVDKAETLYSMDGNSSNLGQKEGKLSLAGNPGGTGGEHRKDAGEEVRAAQRLQILLLHLILLVDLQVLPVSLKLMAKLILGLPKHFQTVALAEAYDIVGCTNDYTRKPLIVPWLQSLSYLCRQSISKEKHFSKDQDSIAPETRSVTVSNPESISKSKSVDITTSNNTVGDTAEDEKKTSNLEPVHEGTKVGVRSQISQPGDASHAVPKNDEDQAGQNDKGLEPMSKL